MAAHSNSGSDARSGGWLSNHYVKIYLILMGLLAISIVGPMVAPRLGEGQFPGLGIRVATFVTLVTAFGIAVVKAWLVVKHFMHLSIERPIAKWFLAASVLLLALFWGGIAPDVQNHAGANWENVAAQAAVARGISEPEAHGDEGEAHDAGAAGEAGTTHDAEAAGTTDAHDSEATHGSDGDAGGSEAGLVPTAKSNANLLPGGYNFTHAAFWSVVGLVAVGTNAVAILLSIGAGLLILETLKGLREWRAGRRREA